MTNNTWSTPNKLDKRNLFEPCVICVDASLNCVSTRNARRTMNICKRHDSSANVSSVDAVPTRRFDWIVVRIPNRDKVFHRCEWVDAARDATERRTISNNRNNDKTTISAERRTKTKTTKNRICRRKWSETTRLRPSPRRSQTRKRRERFSFQSSGRFLFIHWFCFHHTRTSTDEFQKTCFNSTSNTNVELGGISGKRWFP